MSFVKYDIPEDQFLFQSFSGLAWKSQKLEIDHSDLGFNRISIELITNGLGWVALKDHTLFRYAPEICGPILGGGFNPAKPYIITLELHSDQLTLLSIVNDGQSIEDWFHLENVHKILEDSENFLLISTMQPMTANTQWGMTTVYSQSHHI